MTSPWYSLPPGPERESLKAKSEEKEQKHKAKITLAKAVPWIRLGAADRGIQIWGRRSMRAYVGRSGVRHPWHPNDEPRKRLAFLLAQTRRLNAPAGIEPVMPAHDYEYLRLRYRGFIVVVLYSFGQSLELAITEIKELENGKTRTTRE